MAALRLGPLEVTRRALALAGWLGVAAGVAAGCAPAPQDFFDAYAEIVAEEDARGRNGLSRILHHLEAPNPRVRAVAVRALGRLEDPAQLERLSPFLADPDPDVRAAAAVAVAQAVAGSGAGAEAGAESGAETGAGLALWVLAEQVRAEDDPRVLGALATSIGKLETGDEEQRRTAAAGLAAVADRVLAPDAEDHELNGRLGLARGIEAFARGGRGLPAAARDLTGVQHSELVERAARIRRLATAAVVAAGDLEEAEAARFIDDPDWGVRRLAVLGAGAALDTGIADVILAALGDPSPHVRVDALRAYDRQLRDAQGCGPLLRAFGDEDHHAAAVAIGLAANPCPDADVRREALLEVVREAAESDGSWRRSARALHALAATSPPDAVEHLEPLARHSSPFARAWAARTAGVVADRPMLRELAADRDPNVRTAALQGLGATEGAQARDVFAAQLDSTDPLLVMTATRMLTQHAPADVPVPALLDALARFTATGYQTVRDVRIVLLEGIGATDAYSHAEIAPYVADSDPLVAQRAAALIAALDAPAGPGDSAGRADASGSEMTPAATGTDGPALPPPPSADRLRELDRSAVELRMEGLGKIVIALRPRLAATNADRFARLAQAGYFDGLTFHRVVPNFVIQGGSPHANEYAGDGPYTRDEISWQPHWRGTVGLSTRGRDTGDAQIFVNLADNVRLDFNYTIFGEVVEGMDVVDAVQEGAVIEEARVVRR